MSSLLPLFVGFCVCLCLFLLWHAFFYVISNFAFILTRKGDLIALLSLSIWCLVTAKVLQVFLTVRWIGPQICNCGIYRSHSLTFFCPCSCSRRRKRYSLAWVRFCLSNKFCTQMFSRLMMCGERIISPIFPNSLTGSVFKLSTILHPLIRCITLCITLKVLIYFNTTSASVVIDCPCSSNSRKFASKSKLAMALYSCQWDWPLSTPVLKKEMCVWTS